MSKQKQHLLENLLNDSSFKNWVYKKNRNDSAFWNNWIANNPNHLETLYIARDIILGISFKKNTISEKHVAEKLDSVLNHIQSKENSQLQKPVKFLSRKALQLTTMAAAVILLITLSLNLFVSNEVIHKTEFGEILNIKLPDGSTAVLNGNSELRYRKDNPRDVHLIGEAYFKVKPEYATRAKFWVQTEDLQVQVYGTQFTVNTRDDKTNVLLDEGSIHLILENGESKKMVPGEMVSYSKVDKILVHKKINESLKHTLWRGKTYIFNKVTLQEVMKYIEHSYGLSTEFLEDKTKGIVITGGIPNENLRICLDAIQKSTGTVITKKDGKLIITNSNKQ